MKVEGPEIFLPVRYPWKDPATDDGVGGIRAVQGSQVERVLQKSKTVALQRGRDRVNRLLEG